MVHCLLLRPWSGRALTARGNTIETLLQAWDGEAILVRLDRPSGAWIVIALHSSRLGPASGGTRMKSYPTLQATVEDAMALAASMTYKFATVGLPRGGGKAVIAVPPSLESTARLDLLRRYGAFIRQLGGVFQTGPDLGTSAADMDIIAETGAPYIFGRTPAAGGSGDTGPITALGVFHGIRVTSEWFSGDTSLAGKRILVQGAGKVGGRLLSLLHGAGAEVLFSEANPDTVEQVRHELGLQHIPPDDVYDTPCDIFSPCALGGVLNQATIPRLRCRAVAGAANNQLARPEDGELLRARQILYAPDFVVNVGGAMALTGIEMMGWSTSEAEARIVEAITGTLGKSFELATSQDISPAAAARQIAEDRLLHGVPSTTAAPTPTVSSQ